MRRHPAEPGCARGGRQAGIEKKLIDEFVVEAWWCLAAAAWRGETLAAGAILGEAGAQPHGNIRLCYPDPQSEIRALRHTNLRAAEPT